MAEQETRKQRIARDIRQIGWPRLLACAAILILGLYNKLDAYKLQIEEGLDTYEANRRLHFPDDLRDYAVAADMLRALGVSRIRLLTNNPEKVSDLKRNGIAIEGVVPTKTYQTGDNENYLRTKAGQTMHTLKIG